MKRVIVRVLFLHELSCSEVGLHDVEAGRNVAQTERCAFCGSLRCGYGLACDIAYENSLAGVCAANGEKVAVETSVKGYGAVRGESYGCLRALHVCPCQEVETYALVLGVESVNRTVRDILQALVLDLPLLYIEAHRKESSQTSRHGLHGHECKPPLGAA